MKEIVMYLPLIVILVIAFSVGTFFVVRLLRKTQAQKKGVTAFGIIAIVFGSLNTLSNICGWRVFVKEDVRQAFEQYGTTLKYVNVYFTIGAVLAILLLISGIGILKMKKWARRLILGIAAVIIATRIIQFVMGLIKVKHITRVPFELIFALIIWFFNRSSVKAQFRC